MTIFFNIGWQICYISGVLSLKSIRFVSFCLVQVSKVSVLDNFGCEG